MATDKTCADCARWTRGSPVAPAWCAYWHEPAIGCEVACLMFEPKKADRADE